MKRYIPIIIVLLAGCSTDHGISDAEEEYYFRYKADGVQQNYGYGTNQVNLSGSLGYDENTGTYSINIAGIRNIFESGNHTLVIFISDTRGLSTGVNYSNIPGEGDDYPDFLFTMGYYNHEGAMYIAGGQADSPIYMELYEPAFVKFSEISETSIGGTFSGTLIWYDSSQGTNEFIDSVIISEGEFNVPRF